MAKIDFKTLRMRYEILGDTLEDLAVEYSLTSDQIHYLAREEQWTQSLLPTPHVDTKNVEGYAKSLLEATKHKLSILSVYNQLSLRPQYITLEHTLLDKAVQMASLLDPNEPMAVSKLRTLTGILNDLSNRLGLLAGAANEGEKLLNDAGVSVNIIQQFLDGNQQVIQ